MISVTIWVKLAQLTNYIQEIFHQDKKPLINHKSNLRRERMQLRSNKIFCKKAIGSCMETKKIMLKFLNREWTKKWNYQTLRKTKL